MIFKTTLTQFTKMLQNLSAILTKAQAQAELKKYSPSVLLNARLAPDQFPLVMQLQIACDNVKLGAARLVGKEAPTHADDETTIEQVQARIQDVVAFINSLSDADFQGAEERVISQPRWKGKSLNGLQYLQEYVIPNVYFHVTTAYAILRHNGVEVGKQDYLGKLPFKEPS
ncbi:MAG: hypothetical protein RJA70_4692 [Pseudomonadota bacterium]|jgi:hypothetical protein